MEFVVSETYRLNNRLSFNDLDTIKKERLKNVDGALEKISQFDRSSSPEFKDMIDGSKRHLSEVYADSRIGQNVISSSKVLIIGIEDKEKVEQILGYTIDAEGEVVIPLGIALAFSREETKEIMPSIVYHEMEHIVGMLFDIVNARGLSDVIGYSTEYEGVVRGSALEEAIVVNNSILFQEKYDTLNQKFLDKVFHNKIPDKYDKVVDGFFPEIEMLFTLVEGIQKLKGDEIQKEFIGNLVAGRVDSVRRYRMQKTLDEVYGDGTAKELFRLNYDDPQVSEFTGYLKAVIEKRSSKI